MLITVSKGEDLVTREATPAEIAQIAEGEKRAARLEAMRAQYRAARDAVVSYGDVTYKETTGKWHRVRTQKEFRRACILHVWESERARLGHYPEGSNVGYGVDYENSLGRVFKPWPTQWVAAAQAILDDRRAQPAWMDSRNWSDDLN